MCTHFPLKSLATNFKISYDPHMLSFLLLSFTLWLVALGYSLGNGIFQSSAQGTTPSNCDDSFTQVNEGLALVFFQTRITSYTELHEQNSFYLQRPHLNIKIKPFEGSDSFRLQDFFLSCTISYISLIITQTSTEVHVATCYFSGTTTRNHLGEKTLSLRFKKNKI